MATITSTTDLAVYIGGTKITCQTDATLSLTQGTRDTSCKDGNGWRSLLAGLKQWTVSGSGMQAFDAAYGSDELVNHLVDQDVVIVKLSTEDSGDTFYSGSAVFTSLEIASPGVEENVTYSYTLEGTGPLTSGVN